MSKRSKEKKPAPLADWDVVLTFYDGAKVTVPASRWRRDEAGGYTFTDRGGVVADFAPSIVAYVHRKESPAVHEAGEEGIPADVLASLAPAGKR